jgi:hypothetical protein
VSLMLVWCLLQNAHVRTQLDCCVRELAAACAPYSCCRLLCFEATHNTTNSAAIAVLFCYFVCYITAGAVHGVPGLLPHQRPDQPGALHQALGQCTGPTLWRW